MMSLKRLIEKQFPGENLIHCQFKVIQNTNDNQSYIYTAERGKKADLQKQYKRLQ